jgi:hypothetical protein
MAVSGSATSQLLNSGTYLYSHPPNLPVKKGESEDESKTQATTNYKIKDHRCFSKVRKFEIKQMTNFKSVKKHKSRNSFVKQR